MENITAKNTGNAIFIRLGHRNKDEVYSQVRRVRIANVKAEIPAGKPDKGYPEEGPIVRFPHNVFPASVSGIPGHPVEDVTIENVEITYAGGGDENNARMSIESMAKIPEQVAEYPEFSMFGELPVWGFYARHVVGLNLKNITVKAKNKDYRPVIAFDDVSGLKTSNVKILESAKKQQIIFRNTKDESTDFAKELVRKIE